MITRKRTAILISGRGSNMVALADAAKDPSYPAEITLVLSNKPDAAGLKRAEKRGLKTLCLPSNEYKKDRDGYDRAMHQCLVEHEIELVCLAGFMRLLTPWFVDQWYDRLINIHPSLLPAFKGLHTHARALAMGVKYHGVTVHMVRPEMDEGPILAQAIVPVLHHDTEETLAARVLEQEHKIFPQAVADFAAGRIVIEDEKVKWITP
jgi:phosphoribosylglycinamide formyltransferase-1